MKGRDCRPLLFALCALLAGTAGAAAPTKAFPVTLSQRDQAQIAAAACGAAGAPGVEQVAASTREKGSTKISAEVRCRPHAILQAFPVLHYATCGNARGAWRCDAGYDAIHVTLTDSRVLPVVAKGVAPQMAVEAVTEAEKLLVPPFHHPAVDLMRGQCSVEPHPTSPSPEMKLFDIRCAGTSMLLTRHCWTGGCRYFIPQGEGY